MPDPADDARLERAQSEVIGFIIIFSVVLVATSVVGVFGVSALEDVRDSTIADNGEFAMQSVDAGMEALYHGRSTSRTIEFGLDSASLETASQTTVEVIATTPSLSRGSISGTWDFNPIVYRSESADIYYENSLVVRQQSEGAVAVTESLFQLSDDHSVIPVVRTDPTAIASVGGGNHELAAETTGTDTRVLSAESSNTVDVTIVISDVPGRAEVWKRVLNEELSGVTVASPPPCTVNAAGDEVTCDYDTDMLVVSIVDVEYELE